MSEEEPPKTPEVEEETQAAPAEAAAQPDASAEELARVKN